MFCSCRFRKRFFGIGVLFIKVKASFIVGNVVDKLKCEA